VSDYDDATRAAMARTARRHLQPVRPQAVDVGGQAYYTYSCFTYSLERTNFLGLDEVRLFAEELLKLVDEMEAGGE